MLEPTHVMRRRRPRALSDFSDFSELFRPEDTAPEDQEDGRGEGWEHVPLDARRAGSAGATGMSQDTTDTEELPPVPAREEAGPAARSGRERSISRSTALVTVAAIALAAFGIALLLTWDTTGEQPRAAQPAPTGSATPTASIAPPGPAEPATPTGTAPPGTGTAATDGAADPDGAGVLREGDSGSQVSDLQKRLLRIPNVYEGGTVSGTYDTTLAEAVGRFQLWYGVRGDETGVYGDDTRRDLESRTAS